MATSAKLKTLKDRVAALEASLGDHSAIVKFNSQDDYEIAIAIARTYSMSLVQFCNTVVYNNINAFLKEQEERNKAAQAAQEAQKTAEENKDGQ